MYNEKTGFHGLFLFKCIQTNKSVVNFLHTVQVTIYVDIKTIDFRKTILNYTPSVHSYYLYYPITFLAIHSPI